MEDYIIVLKLLEKEIIIDKNIWNLVVGLFIEFGVLIGGIILRAKLENLINFLRQLLVLIKENKLIWFVFYIYSY